MEKMMLLITVNERGELNITFDTNDRSNENANLIGAFMTQLTYGCYGHSLYSAIKDFCDGDNMFLQNIASAAELAKNVLIKDLEKTVEEKDHELVMPPLNFFKENDFNGR